MPIVCEELAELNNSVTKTSTFRTQEEMGTSILFDKETPLQNIAQYVKGYKWEVDYFLQLRNLNDVFNAPDINISPAVQKYHRINKLILTLETPIQQDNIDNITGAAVISAGMLPNVDDVFMSTIVGGREAIFIITSVATRSYNLHPIYYVEFKLFRFVDTAVNMYNDLILKTVKTYYYDKDHLLDYSAPIILAEDFKRKINYKNKYPEVIEYYFKYFISKDKNIIAPPTEASIYTDTFLTEFIYKILNQSDIPNSTKITRVSYEPDTVLYTIWDVILQRNIELLKRVNTNIRFIYVPWIKTDPVLRTLGYTGVNFMADALEDITTAVVPTYKTLFTLDKPENYQPPLGGEMTYVVSDRFYSLDQEHFGVVEKTLYSYLKGNIVDTTELDYLLDTYQYWTTIEQYYLIPILLVFIKDAIMTTYTEL
jgi:hypothetical protein